MGELDKLRKETIKSKANEGISTIDNAIEKLKVLDQGFQSLGQTGQKTVDDDYFSGVSTICQEVIEKIDKAATIFDEIDLECQ